MYKYLLRVIVLSFFKIRYFSLVLIILNSICTFYIIEGYAKVVKNTPSLPYNIYYSKNSPLNEQIVFLTDFGAVVIVLDTKNAPESTKIFVQLIRNNYYSHTSFYRMYNNYFIQGGDPSESGIGNAGIPFPIENFTNGTFNEGTIALSNKNLEPKTTGSQFFITFLRTPWLDNKYTVIGSVFSGLDILRSFFGKYETNYRGILTYTIPMEIHVLEDYIKQHPEYKNNFKPTIFNKKLSILELLSNENFDNMDDDGDDDLNIQNILNHNYNIIPLEKLYF